LKPDADGKFTQEQMNQLAGQIREEVRTQMQADIERQKTEAEQAAREKALKEQGDFKALYEAEQGKHQKTKDELAKAKRENLLFRVQIKYRLPDNLAKRLQGDTLEALEADAQELVKDLGGPIAPDTEGGRSGVPAPAAPANGHAKKPEGVPEDGKPVQNPAYGFQGRSDVGWGTPVKPQG